MSDVSNIIAGFDTERSVAAPFTGVFQDLGVVLAYNPVIMVFDNQSSNPIEVSLDGVNVWKTYTSKEALGLDLRTNHGKAYNFTVPIGTQFRVRGTGGADSFRLSIIFAE